MVGGIMSVDVPKSGQTIQKSDIQDMHESVRTVINNVNPIHIGRESLGIQHFTNSTGVVVHADSIELVGAEKNIMGINSHLPHSAAALISINTTSDPYDLTPNEKYTLVVYFNCRIRRYLDNNLLTTLPDPQVMTMFQILTRFEKSNGTIVDKWMTTSHRGVHFFDHEDNHHVSATWGRSQEIPVSIWSAQSIDGDISVDFQDLVKLRNIMVQAGHLKCGATKYNLSDRVTVSEGTLGFLLFRD